MPYFIALAAECDILAFRALPSGKIPAVCAKEIASFLNEEKPIFEIPSMLRARFLSLEDTCEYLMGGQR